MKPMIEVLESRMLLSASPTSVGSALAVPVAASSHSVQPHPFCVGPQPTGTLQILYFSGSASYSGKLQSSYGRDSALGNFVIQNCSSWGTLLNRMTFDVVGLDGAINQATGTFSGRRFSFQVRSAPGRLATFSGKMSANGAMAAGTYSVATAYSPWMSRFAKQLNRFLETNLNGTQVDSGTFSLSRLRGAYP